MKTGNNGIEITPSKGLNMMDGKPIKYCLEIYGPDETDTCLTSMNALTPFQSVSNGDFLYVEIWNNDINNKWVRVIQIQRIVSEYADEILDKIMVFTEKCKQEKIK